MTLILLFLLFLLIFIIGFFNSIFVNPGLFIYHWDKVLIIFITILTIKKVSDKDSIISKGFHYKNQKRNIKTFMSILIGIPILLSILIHISIPSIMHKLVAKESTKSVIVSKKTNREKRCLTYIYTTDKTVKGFCINKDIYDNIHIGDRLLLKGTSSIFGFSLDRVIKDNKTERKEQATPLASHLQIQS